MKKSIYYLAAVAAMLLSFSCSREMEIVNEDENLQEGFLYNFRIADDAATKTTLDDVTVNWESGDKIGVFAAGTTNKAGSISSLSPVVFPVTLDAALSVGDMVYCYFPQSSSNNSKTASTVSLTIPASQTGDFDAMPQVSIPYETTSAMASGSNNVGDIYFCNLGSIVRFLVYSSTGAYDDETVESIKFTANTALAGSFTFNLTTVDYSDPSTLAISGYSSLWAETTASPAIGTNASNAGIANLVIAPGTYFGTVVLKTDKAKYTYSLTESNKITFVRSKIKKIGLDLESANCTREEFHPVGEVFVPATSIAAGDKILLASGTSGSVYVMGKQNTNNRTAVSYSVDGAIISTADTYPMVVGTGSTEPTYYTLYDTDEEGYLYAAASGNNYLRTESTVSVNSEWQIEIDANSKATKLQATGSSNRKVMQYNSTSHLFSCYSSASQSPIYVFKKSTATVVAADNQDIAYNVTSVEIPYSVFNASGATTVAFKTNPGSCASNLAINEGTKKVTFDITTNAGVTRTVEVDITNNSVTKTVTINQAAAPTTLVMSTINAVPGQNQIAFSWDAVDDVEGYQISTDGGASYGATQTATSYTWTGLSSFTSYTIMVKAIGDGVYFLDSDAVSKTQKTTLATPTSITWTGGTKTVSWTDNNTGAGAYGTVYKYQYTVDNGESFTDIAAPGSSVVLSIDATKTFKIKAVCIADATLNSALSSGTVCNVGMAAIYSASFDNAGEYRSSGTNYDSSGAVYSVSGVNWTCAASADIVTSGSVIEGTASVGFRIRSNQTNTPNVTTANIVSASKTIKKVTFQMTKTSAAVTFTAEYSTDGGSNWEELSYSSDSDVDATNGYSATLNVTTSDFRLRFTASVTSTTKSNRDQRLDNVIVYAE